MTTDFSTDQIKGLNIALNEAEILGIELDKANCRIGMTLLPPSLDKDGNVPNERRVVLLFQPVGRFVASYRMGRWDDKDAPVVKFEPEQILEKIGEFQQHYISGWNFINSDKFKFDSWKDRASFDYSSGVEEGMAHTIDLFQDQSDKIIDIRIWFGDFKLYTPSYEPIAFQDFIDGGKRAWDSIYAGGEKAKQFGIQTGPVPYTNLDHGESDRGGGMTHKPL